MSSSMIAVPARQTYGGFGEVDTIESIDAIADRDGSDDEILASIEEGYKRDYASSFPRGSGVRREGVYGYGGLGAFGSLYGNKSNGIRRFYPGAGYRGFGEGTLTINGTSVPVDTSGLGMAIAKTAVYAVLGYYVGGKLGPASSSSAAAGAVACAFGGPIGLAIVAAYYGGKR